MASAIRVFREFRSSDGRIKVATSGVLALVAVIALLVGVLPAMADADHTGTHEVHPQVVTYGGGSGACSATIDGRLPSAAGNEFHINNPMPGTTSYDLPDGKTITLTVKDRTTEPAGRVFDFTIAGDSDFVVYDVIVNGGRQNNHYDYDGNNGPGPVKSDTALHAPRKNTKSLHNLSHINICYDVPGVTLFACNEPVKRESNGLFAVAEATIFANSVLSCDGKRASFLIEDGGDAVTLAFTGDTGEKIAGRLDVVKEFGGTSFEDLQYDPEPPFNEADFVDVQWCATRPFATGDGIEFSDWLPTGEDGLYPLLPGQETACKVAENEDLSGTQYTVVYFEFEDPQFR